MYIRLITPLGSWWAEPELGSLLHTLVREKDLPRIALLARQYAEEALRPMVKDGRAKAVNVRAEQPQDGRLYLHVEVQTAAGVYRYKHTVKLI